MSDTRQQARCRLHQVWIAIYFDCQLIKTLFEPASGGVNRLTPHPSWEAIEIKIPAILR